MGRILFLVFLSVPIVEIALFILIGQAIGLWPTLLGVLVTAVLGSWAVRVQGMALLAQIRETMGRGLLPGRELASAMLVAIGGVLLLTPGYFTDSLGLLLMIPAVREAIYRFLRSRMQIVASVQAAGFASGEPEAIDLGPDNWRPRR